MEILRRAARGVLGPYSNLYRLGASTLNFLSTIRKDSYSTWRILKELNEGKATDGGPRLVTLKNLEHPILIRPGTPDAGTIMNNVIREEHSKFTLENEPVWMIDAGAYIGDTTAYFLSKFPRLKVIALEPDPTSFEIARRNLEPYGENAILLQRGLFSDEQNQRISGSETTATIGDSGLEIECTTITALLKKYSIPKIDILKMDIEGAEEPIFLSKPEAWLKHTQLLLLETHGPHIVSLVARVLKENNFSMKRYRNLWYCHNKNR